MKMNKRGFLLGEETIKLILAVIAILFLVLFVVYLYNNFSQNKELEQAKASLEHLTSGIEAGSTEIEIYNPLGWVLSSWPSSSPPLIPGSETLPAQCSNNQWNNCLCICTLPSGSVKTFVIACNTKGTCMQSDFSVNGDIINIQNPPLILSINQEEKTIQKSGT